MSIFKCIIPVVFFTIINSAISVIWKKTFGKCLPFTFISSILIVFFSQLLFGTFQFGMYFLLILFPVSIYFLIRKKEEKQYYLTNGLCVFFCLSVLFLFIDFGRHFFLDDELGFWGKMVKEMIRMDKFYYLNESTLRGHNDYPPFIPLFEYIWCKLSLGFSECVCTFALHIFEFGIIVPTVFDEFLSEKSNLQRILTDILLCISFAGIVIYLDCSDVFNAIYTDTLLGMEFAYGAYLIYTKNTESIFGLINYCMILITILMTKQVGIAFFMLSVFYFLISNLNNTEKRIPELLFYMIVPISFYFLWNRIIAPYDIVKQFDLNRISFSGFKEVLSGTTYQFEAVKLYVNALFKTNIYSSPIPVTFISALLLAVLLLELLKRHTGKERILSTELTCFVGTAGYAFMMLLLYAFCYPEREALVLQSYSRYMSSYTCAMFLSIFVFYAIDFKERIEQLDTRKMLIGTLAVLVLFDGNRLLNFAPQVILGDRFGTYRNLAEKFEKELPQGSMVYILYDHDGADSYPAFVSYYCEDIYLSKVNIDLFANDYSSTEEYQRAIGELQKHDYMYVVDVSDSFNHFFASINEGNEYQTDCFYRIIKENNEIRMEKVN